MEPSWAADNLQVIRTLMERSSLYRRALAPLMTVAGAIGLAASIFPCFKPIHSSFAFGAYWMTVGVVSLLATFILVRRQAIQDKEPLWSPPTRRIAQAVMPAFLMGFVAGILFTAVIFPNVGIWFLPSIWMICYGCGLHAAGFFMQRGIRLFGWIFAAAGAALMVLMSQFPRLQSPEAGHYVMGIFFGLAHIAYGVYLYFSEKRKNAA